MAEKGSDTVVMVSLLCCLFVGVCFVGCRVWVFLNSTF